MATIYLTDNSTIGLRVLSRAKLEVERNDHTLGIILAAMAVECELTFLFFKWKRIDQKMSDTSADVQVSEHQETAWVKEYRNWGGIKQKLENFCTLATGCKFDRFVGDRQTLSKLVEQRHPSSGMSRGEFFEGLFKKRNEVVHNGKLDFRLGDAEEALDQASTLFSILAAMDRVRFDRVFTPRTAI